MFIVPALVNFRFVVAVCHHHISAMTANDGQAAVRQSLLAFKKLTNDCTTSNRVIANTAIFITGEIDRTASAAPGELVDGSANRNSGSNKPNTA